MENGLENNDAAVVVDEDAVADDAAIAGTPWSNVSYKVTFFAAQINSGVAWASYNVSLTFLPPAVNTAAAAVVVVSSWIAGKRAPMSGSSTVTISGTTTVHWKLIIK